MASTKTITVTNETVTIPAMTDRPDASQFSDGVSKLVDGINSNTQAIANTQGGLAYIVGNTNTTGNTLAVGQFVYVKGHSTITEGLRTVTASISANGNITTSNTSACSEGGLNALNSNLSKHYVQIASQSGSDIWESVQATLNLYPHYDSLSSGDYVTIAGGYLGNYTYALHFTRTQSNFQVGTVQAGTSVYPFTFDNSTNTLLH